MEQKLMSISEFGQFAGISRKTLIFYDKSDVLKPIKRNEKGYRWYSRDQIYTVTFIKILQSLNYSLTDIKELLSQPEKWDLEAVLQEQIQEIDRQQIQLAEMKEMLHSQLTYLQQPHPSFETAVIQSHPTYQIKCGTEVFKLTDISLSEALHLVMSKYQSFTSFPDGALIYKEAGEWQLRFYDYQKEEAVMTDYITFYRKNFAQYTFSTDSLDEVMNRLARKFGCSLLGEIYVESQFSDSIASFRDNFLFKFSIPVNYE